METPHSHACDIGTIDYSNAGDGEIYCTECGRTWTFVEEKGWKPDPISRWKPGSANAGTITRGSNYRYPKRGR